MKTQHICFALGALASLCATPVAAQGNVGSITGLVFDVQEEEGQPKAGVPIQLAGSTGTTTVATSSSSGSATVPYGNSVPSGTQVGVYVLTLEGVPSIVMIPEGANSEECEKARDQSEDSCTLVGAITWARTRSSAIRLGTAPEMIAAVLGGPVTQSMFFGPAISRNLEFEAFKIGVELGRTFFPVLQNSLLFGSLNLGRLGISNGATIWNAALTAGVLTPTSNPGLWWRAAAGVLMNRQSSEFASGSEFGAAFRAGVVFGFAQTYGFAVDAGVQRVRGQTQLTVGTSVLFNLLQR